MPDRNLSAFWSSVLDEASRTYFKPVDAGDNLTCPEGTRTADETVMLPAMLECYRAAVLRKVEGIDTAVARTSPVRSGTTIAALVKHLALVEDDWFDHRFAGNPEREPWASAPWDADRDWEFHSAVDDSMEELVGLYRQACERSRRAADGHALDDRAASSAREFTLRFAYVHLLEETMRHLGQMDILRELLDGSTGE